MHKIDDVVYYMLYIYWFHQKQKKENFWGVVCHFLLQQTEWLFCNWGSINSHGISHSYMESRVFRKINYNQRNDIFTNICEPWSVHFSLNPITAKSANFQRLWEKLQFQNILATKHTLRGNENTHKEKS